MGLVQYIFTSIMHHQADPEYAYTLCRQSVGICNKLNITGRVFANDIEALAILEGPSTIADKYIDSVKLDPLVDSVIMHFENKIETREFSDYLIWLNSQGLKDKNPQINALTATTLSQAIPESISPKVRIMATAFLSPLGTS